MNIEPANPSQPAIPGAIAPSGALPPTGAVRADDPAILDQLDALVERVGGKPGSFGARLVRDLLVTGLKLLPDGRDTGEIKLITTAVKEMRHAYRVFGRYKEPHKVTIFGSARTGEDHPDYTATVEFSKLMAEAGWMIITGAGGGIMAAGHVGPGRAASFGVAIRLPFETTANHVIAGDEKLIHFRYFFTRKLMFLSQAEAVVLCPGGFGTMDEAYETLTLVQTGKAGMIPIVLLEGKDGQYWHAWDRWVKEQLLPRGLITPGDERLYYMAKDPADAARHVVQFYRNYHSARYVRDDYVVRMKRPLSDKSIQLLNEEFAAIVKEGKIVQRGPYDVEDEYPELPRLAFTHTRSKFATIRRLIDRINELAPE